MATQETHKKVYFLRTIRVRREHIQGDADDGNNGLMRIVERGSELKLLAPQALLLTVDESVCEVRAANKDKIDADKAEMKAEQDGQKERAIETSKKKTA